MALGIVVRNLKNAVTNKANCWNGKLQQRVSKGTHLAVLAKYSIDASHSEYTMGSEFWARDGRKDKAITGADYEGSKQQGNC